MIGDIDRWIAVVRVTGESHPDLVRPPGLLGIPQLIMIEATEWFAFHRHSIR